MKLKTMLLMTGVATLVFSAPAFADEEAIAAKAGCLACHTRDKRVVGPAYKEVAAKYKGQADAAAKLADKVRKGGQGVWGPIPMPPNPAAKINDADLNAVVRWILKG
ncbi:MAG: c-type cytochrome [Betaproteobacteria bacterium]|nr:c-type cytochrome [Betaproteobacteria bacterium]